MLSQEMDVWLGITRFNNALLATTAQGICAFFFGPDEETLIQECQKIFPKVNMHFHDVEKEKNPIFEEIAQALVQNHFEFHYPLDLSRGTPFQREVWECLQTIPFGETRTYKQIAEQIGRPKAARAVAQACAANILALLIPCNRVVRSDQTIGGYRWGEEFKMFLLLCESIVTENKLKKSDKDNV